MATLVLLAAGASAFVTHAPLRATQVPRRAFAPQCGAANEVQELTSLEELHNAVRACGERGRLAVIKWYSPGCKTCIASAPKYTRLAKAESERHDFFQVRLTPPLPRVEPTGELGRSSAH